MRINLRPLTFWVSHQNYKIRFKKRDPLEVLGILTTTEGEVDFRYEPPTKTIHLPDRSVTINNGGFELTP